jgi:phosphoserine aminotransferase
MRTTRNFYPGPCALPLPVLERIRDELLDYCGTGMSIMEISHRAAPVMELMDDTTATLKRLLGLGDDYEVLLLQGGGSLQFSMVPMNFSAVGGKVDYVESGIWAQRAIAEAEHLKRDVRIVASSAPHHDHIPMNWRVRPDSAYLHICTNNTIVGTQFHEFPEAPAGVPLIADLSSDILSRDIDHRRFGLIYAHAQKSFGAAGVTIVALRRDLMERIPNDLPTMLDYRTHVQASSNYNTPPVFAIYVVRLVLDWIENHIGGVAALGRINTAKAAAIYDVIDESPFYTCAVAVPARSQMNVVFSLPNADLEQRFCAEATRQNLVGLEGHRKWRGCRASLYNAVSLDDAEVLAEFMRTFAKSHAKDAVSP